jgi:hypothetical protein
MTKSVSLTLITLATPVFAPALLPHPVLLEVIALLLLLVSHQISADLLLLFQPAIPLALMLKLALSQAMAVYLALENVVMLPLANLGKSAVRPLHPEV